MIGGAESNQALSEDGGMIKPNPGIVTYSSDESVATSKLSQPTDRYRRTSTKSSSPRAPSITEFTSAQSSSGNQIQNPSNLPNENTLILAIMRGRRRYPLSQKDFQNYLNSIHCGELLRFFLDVERFEQLAVQEGDRMRSAAWSLAEDIANRYIQRLSRDEINISNEDREEILNRVQTTRQSISITNRRPSDPGLDPNMFGPAKDEVLNMLRGDILNGFIRAQTQCNISDFERKRRLFASVILGTIAIAVIAVLMWIQTFAVAPFNLRWWRLLAYPFLCLSMAFFLSFRNKVCTGLARTSVRMESEKDSWFLLCFYGITRRRRETRVHFVQDEFARNHLKHLGKRIELKALAIATLAMGVVLALPPGYGVPNGVP